jgi:hypothetical protein
MRTILDVNGNDVTASVQAFLLGNQSLVMVDLVRFLCIDFWNYNPDGNYVNFAFTNADFPVFVDKYQVFATGAAQLGTWAGGSQLTNGLTFLPENIVRDKFEYSVGFESNPCELSWWMDDNVDYGLKYTGSSLTAALSPVGLTLKQAFLLGVLDEAPFWIHRAIFSGLPSHGGTLLGTTLMYRGFLRDVDVGVDHLILSVDSLLSVFQDTQIPTQTITPNARRDPYYPAAGGPTPGGAFVNGLTPLTPWSLELTSTFGTFSYTRDQLKDCYCTFGPFLTGANYPGGILPVPGLPPPPSYRISGNDAGSGHNVVLYFYKPYILPTNSPINFNIFGQNTMDSGNGFPDVPPPELSL